ncbi:MAG: hypothetical protein HYW89_04385 [Candidatus Sungiibacteriota bacterium]|uniref:Uncharacterized protein n=1 Tax=Candidatus Sungiibacteriota bacterium TaxID=2750080 RepID=A0A7T5RJD7_9BACT|nr:MAG: hypothetical protein HYW89_04385 [Candidatus Sungbacteria bacterium]
MVRKPLSLGLFLLLWVAFVTACGSSGGGGSGSQGGGPSFNLPSDLSAFLVKKVCIDNPQQDPYTCTNRRELMPGESLHISNVDMEDSQVSDALPLADGRVVATFDFPPFHIFNNDIDGYDLAGKSLLFYGIQVTRDPVSKGVTWFRRENGVCSQFDSWILFPRFHSGNGMLSGHIVALLHGEPWEKKGLPYPGLCTGTDVPALTKWSSQIVVYTSHGTPPVAKVMLTIVSEHYNSASEETATMIEIFYSTDVYGFRTRWELWVRQEIGESPVSDQKCNGPKRKGPWLMVDCRDFSKVRVNSPPFDSVVWLVHVPVP